MTGLELVDLRLAMSRLEAAEGPIRQEVFTAAGWLVRVVHVIHAEGARFEHVATAPMVAMVLGGVGSLMVGDWRVTVLPGQLVPVAAGQRVAFIGDGSGALVAALLQLEQPALVADEADEGLVDVT